MCIPVRKIPRTKSRFSVRVGADLRFVPDNSEYNSVCMHKTSISPEAGQNICRETGTQQKRGYVYVYLSWQIFIFAYGSRGYCMC